MSLKVFDLQKGQVVNQCKEPLIGLTDSPLSFSCEKDLLFMSGKNHIMFFKLRSEQIISDLDCDDLKDSRISISNDLRFVYLLSESGKNIKKLSLNDLEEVWTKKLPAFRNARFKKRGQIMCIIDGQNGRKLENADNPNKNQLINDGDQMINQIKNEDQQNEFQVLGVGNGDPKDEIENDMVNEEFNDIKPKKINKLPQTEIFLGSGLYMIDVEKLESNVRLRDDAGVLEIFRSFEDVFAFDWSPPTFNDEEMLVMLKNGNVYSVRYNIEDQPAKQAMGIASKFATLVNNAVENVKSGDENELNMADVLSGNLISLNHVFDPFKKETPVVKNNKIIRNFTKEFKESNIDNLQSEWVSEDGHALNTLKKMATTTSRKSRFHNQAALKPECIFSSKHTPNLNLLCMSDSPNDTTGQGYFKIFSHYEGVLAKAKIRMECMEMEDMGEEFKILEIYNKKRYKKKKFHFLIYSESKIFLVFFRPKKKTLEVCKILNKQVNEGVDIQYIPDHKLFLVPYENTVEIWDRSFTYRIFSIPLDEKVSGINYSHLKQTVILFDKTKKLECQKKDYTSKIRKIYLNYEHCLELQDFKIPDINYLNQLEVLAPGLRLDFCEFPFESIMNSFSFDNYQKPIMNFSRFYFSKLTLSRDSFFESVNPIHFAIFHGDSKLLEKILEKYGYPREFESEMTPLEYAHVRSSLSAIETICSYLVRSDKSRNINFTNLEFNILLSSELKSAHDVLSEVLASREDRNFPNMAEMKKDLRVDEKSSVLSFLLKLQKGGRKSKDEDGSVETVDPEKKQKKKISFKKEQIKSEIDVLTVPFVYDYSFGSENSVDFLKFYSTSKSDKFVTSEWKHLINEKWKLTKLVQMIICLMYFGFIAFATLVLVFDEGHIEHTRILLSLVSIFIAYEVFQVFSYAIYDIVHYLKDLWNYIDWVFFIVTFIYPNTLQGEKHREGPINKLLGVVILVLMYYRGFSFLRIFDYFTSLVGMINTIFIKIIPFMLVLFYMYGMVVLMFLKLTTPESLTEYLKKSYYYMLFGGITSTDFDIVYSGIPLIFGTVIITIILLNILIAYLSNVFSRLEEQETINTLREKAQMILDLELIIRFFRKILCLSGKKQSKNRLKKILSDQNYSPYVAKIKASKKTDEKKKFKMLFLVKKVNHEVSKNEEIFEEQILDSIENLNQKIEGITSLMSHTNGNSTRHRRNSVVNKFVFGEGPLSTQHNPNAINSVSYKRKNKNIGFKAL